MARMTLTEAMDRPSTIDRMKLDATTDQDVRRHMIEDGQDPDDGVSGWQVVLPPRTVREKLGLRQADFAAVLRVPLATVRNWEQGRTLPDPAARSLLNVVARAPEAVLTALSPNRREEWRALSHRSSMAVNQAMSTDRPLTASDDAMFHDRTIDAVDARLYPQGSFAVGTVVGTIEEVDSVLLTDAVGLFEEVEDRHDAARRSESNIGKAHGSEPKSGARDG